MNVYKKIGLILIIILCIIGIYLSMNFISSIIPKSVESFESSELTVNDYDKDISNKLENNEIIFLKLYADWCPHCTKMANDWNKLYSKYNNTELNNKTINILKIEESNENMKKYIKNYGELEGYPTIVLLKKGKSPLSFDGERVYLELEKFILEKV